ncbi:hypothetical protein B9G69_004745 [Bdellovibrio sp. SKB1291214]|uniref:hypothetical protein n=1 Tax=Bdellovibrio sp. SKB1291214 TaxID=1732569 RepID=UPI000B51B989|nr:hypothetical protein [Bdellovibrio sp. SKB1291214]UYL09881.1 hypothetical protein B9G69_004745 [Bdellovibrio sp. SKB1291214]
MKNRTILFAAISMLLSGCAGQVVKYDSDTVKSGVIKVALGSKENVHVSDKIYLLERKCVEKTPKVPLCKFEPIGTLTVREVKDTYSIVEPDRDLIFKEGYYFKFAMHCEGNAEKCRDDGAIDSKSK